MRDGRGSGEGANTDCRRRTDRLAGERRPQTRGYSRQCARTAVPGDDGGSGKQLRAGLWPHHRLSQSGGFRHTVGRGHRLCGSHHHALLRFAAGQGDGMVAHRRGDDRPHASRAVGVSDSRRGDQPALSRSVDHPPALRHGRLHHQVHRSNAGVVPHSAQARSGHPALKFRRRGDRQRQSGGQGPRPSRLACLSEGTPALSCRRRPPAPSRNWTNWERRNSRIGCCGNRGSF